MNNITKIAKMVAEIVIKQMAEVIIAKMVENDMVFSSGNLWRNGVASTVTFVTSLN